MSCQLTVPSFYYLKPPPKPDYGSEILLTALVSLPTRVEKRLWKNVFWIEEKSKNVFVSATFLKTEVEEKLR